MTVVLACSGVDAVAAIRDLEGRLGVDGAVSGPVEVERGGVDPVAVIGVVLAGVNTAHVLWDWWKAARSSRVIVRVNLADGRVLDLEGCERSDLEALAETADDDGEGSA